MTKYLLVEDIDFATYELKETEDTIKIKPTNVFGNQWNLNNCTTTTLLDTNNGVKVQVGKHKLNLNYGDAADLLMILKVYNDRHPLTGKNIKEFDIEELKSIRG